MYDSLPHIPPAIPEIELQVISVEDEGKKESDKEIAHPLCHPSM